MTMIYLQGTYGQCPPCENFAYFEIWLLSLQHHFTGRFCPFHGISSTYVLVSLGKPVRLTNRPYVPCYNTSAHVNNLMSDHMVETRGVLSSRACQAGELVFALPLVISEFALLLPSNAIHF